MEIGAAVLAPVAAGALLYIIDMLLPDSRLAQAASAVAGIVVVHALLTPVLGWLSGSDVVNADEVYIDVQQILIEPDADDMDYFYYMD